jgi:hypothetical protein
MCADAARLGITATRYQFNKLAVVDLDVGDRHLSVVSEGEGFYESQSFVEIVRFLQIVHTQGHMGNASEIGRLRAQIRHG